MVPLGPAQQPIILPKYKHMMPEDTLIWRQFIRNGKYLPDQVWYDVRVGHGIQVPTGQPNWMHKFAEYSYRKRIDIVWRKSLDYWIVECKPFAGIVALGQVIYYGVAFELEYRPERAVGRAIITDQVDPDLVDLFESLGVVVFEVGKVGD